MTRPIAKSVVVLLGLQLTVLITLNALCVISFNQNPFDGMTSKSNLSKISLTNHDPIIIDGNEDFINQATLEGWLGDGSPSSPFVIENWNISTSSGSLLEISNTDLHFCVSNCHFLGINHDWFGINLINVYNSHFTNNLIQNCKNPVHFQDCQNINFTGNMVKENGNGVNGWGSDLLFKDNIISDNNGTGIRVTSTTDDISITVSGNEIRNNNGTGIVASTINITDNLIEYNTNRGIIANGFYNQIIKNVISSNSPTESDYTNVQTVFGDKLQLMSVSTTAKLGIYPLHGVGLFLNNAYGTVKYNIIKDHVSHGIVLNCAYYEIKYNQFIDNNLNQELGDSQGYEDNTGYDNTVSSNYWNDWVSPDEDSDGIVDTPYSLDGSAKRKDFQPLVSFSHEVSVPSIIYPIGGETVSGIIEVKWDKSVDDLGHWVKYKLYYSNDSGSSWKLIMDDSFVNSFEWNTSAVSDGSNYMIKIVATCEDREYAEALSNKFIIQNTRVVSSTPAVTLSLGIYAIIILTIKKRKPPPRSK